MKDQIRIYIDKNMPRNAYEVYIMKRTSQGSMVGKINWEPISEGLLRNDPSFTLSANEELSQTLFIKSLVENLIDLKIIEKPITIEQVERELQATKHHLNDMRDYSDRLLDAVLEPKTEITIEDRKINV